MPTKLTPPVIGDLVRKGLSTGIWRVLNVIEATPYPMVEVVKILHDDYSPVGGNPKPEVLTWGLYADYILDRSQVIETVSGRINRYTESLRRLVG